MKRAAVIVTRCRGVHPRKRQPASKSPIISIWHLQTSPITPVRGKTLPPAPEEFLDYVLIDAERLQSRIAELGDEISRDYQGKSLILVGILKGSLLFMADLMRHITAPNTVDFMDVTSYGAGKRSSTGDVRILMDLHLSIENRHVLIIEDIIDSGHTMAQVLRLLSARRPASLKVCSLLDKAERREVDLTIDYVGFPIENVFVFGYGLDIDEFYRNLPYIGVVKPGAEIQFGQDDAVSS
jgi:hypoxanthine phosphoribosyltransferase